MLTTTYVSHRDWSRSALGFSMGWAACLLLFVGMTAAQEASPVEKAQAALQQARNECEAADEALAQKAAEVEAAVAAVKSAEATAQQTADDAAAAQRSAAEAQALADQAQKAAGEQRAAARQAAEGGDAAAAQKADANATAAEQAATAAVEKAEAAQKLLVERQNAANKATEAVAAAKRAVEKTRAAQAAAKRQLAQKQTAATAAQEKMVAETAYHAQAVVVKLRGEIVDLQKSLGRKRAAVQRAALRSADAAKAAELAQHEQAASQQALEQAAEADKPARQKTLDARITAARDAARKAKNAQSALAKAEQEIKDGEQEIQKLTVALRAAQEPAAAAHAAVLGGLAPLAADQWDYSKARHLLVRAGFGGSPDEVQRLYEMGLHDAVDYLVNIDDQPTMHLTFEPRRLERAEPWESRLEDSERRDLSDRRRRREREQQAALRRWWLQRMAESPRPLQEKLALFWHDHFAVQYRDLNRTSLVYQQNELFRTYGCDSYAALLRGIVHDPAMIRYLNNDRNFKGNGNENLGREILELFSMGEGQGYTENDLREASRALTGYSYDPATEQFRFLALRHDETSKTIFGRKGAWGGDDLVDLILRQPATAQYITQKLFAFFAYEQPDSETIDRLAHVLRNGNYDLRPMLKNLFLSEQFYSERARGTHIKGPVELVVGAIRDLGLDEVDYASVDSMVGQMGQTLFEPPNVAGWDEDRAWVNAERILVRYNRVADLVERSNVDLVARLQEQGLRSSEEVVNYLAKMCLVRNLDETKRQELMAFLGEMPPAEEWENSQQLNAKLRALVVLLMSTPESQMG